MWILSIRRLGLLIALVALGLTAVHQGHRPNPGLYLSHSRLRVGAWRDDGLPVYGLHGQLIPVYQAGVRHPQGLLLVLEKRGDQVVLRVGNDNYLWW